MQYSVERIFHRSHYQSLLDYFIQSLDLSRGTANSDAMAQMYEILNGDSGAAELNDFAGALVRLFLGAGKCGEFLRMLTRYEINSTTNADLIFRGNTMATKAVDWYMKIRCSEYLHDTLEGVAKEIFLSDHSCEIDPAILEKEDDAPKHQARLQGFILKLVNAIFASAMHCPPELMDLFHDIRQHMLTRFGDVEGTGGLTAISGFIFLRLFSAALQGPHLHPFSLVPDIPEKTARRTFTLCSKAVQTLANLHLFTEKETYMVCLNEFVEANGILKRMREFLMQISGGPDLAPANVRQSLLSIGNSASSSRRFSILSFRSMSVINVGVNRPGSAAPNSGPLADSDGGRHGAAELKVSQIDMDRELAYILRYLRRRRDYLDGVAVRAVCAVRAARTAALTAGGAQSKDLQRRAQLQRLLTILDDSAVREAQLLEHATPLPSLSSASSSAVGPTTATTQPLSSSSTSMGGRSRSPIAELFQRSSDAGTG